jgi:uncharacterized membrane protein YgcG
MVIQPGRIWRHIAATRRGMRRAFSDSTLLAIEQAVQASEKLHGGEIRFAVETELGWQELFQGLTPRQRAVEVFSLLRVWDTEHNNGVLIYVLHADRAVEIVADRGFRDRVDDAAWGAICTQMRARFAQGEFEAGALAGVRAVGRLMAAHFPTRDGQRRDDIADRPAIL